jgi:transcriptional regulator with XRE-family HTH domain
VQTVGQRVQELRNQAGLTRAELAERAGVALSNVGFVERDKRPSVALETISRIAQALNVTIDYLAYGIESPGEATPPAKETAGGK